MKEIESDKLSFSTAAKTGLAAFLLATITYCCRWVAGRYSFSRIFFGLPGRSLFPPVRILSSGNLQGHFREKGGGHHLR